MMADLMVAQRAEYLVDLKVDHLVVQKAAMMADQRAEYLVECLVASKVAY